MANYNGCCRSNYFRVRDPAAFERFCDELDLEVIRETRGEATIYGFVHADAIPSERYDEETGESIGIEDFAGELASHLAEGEVAVVQESGHLKLAAVSGYAFAVNAAGERVSIHLDEIYQRAAALGGSVSRAED